MEANEETKKLAKHLISLVQLDIDAIHAYQQAIKEITVPEVRDQLTTFQRDHEAHVNNLSPFIVQQGEQPPKFKPDFKGYLIQGFTALRSSTGTEGALKAMKSNEQLTTSTYEKALSWDLPNDVRVIVEKNRLDEVRHLAYIEKAIVDRIWESGSNKVA